MRRDVLLFSKASLISDIANEKTLPMARDDRTLSIAFEVTGQASIENASVEAEKSRISIQIEIAQRQVKAGQFQEAEEGLQAILSANESLADAHALLGYVQMRLNKPKDSLQEFTRAAQLRRPTAEELRSVGEDYALLDDYRDADHWTTLAVLQNQNDPEIWYSLGRIRYSLQRFQEAAQCFEKTLSLVPGSVKAANNPGLAYEGLNRTEDAMREYRRAIAWQVGSTDPRAC